MFGTLERNRQEYCDSRSMLLQISNLRTAVLPRSSGYEICSVCAVTVLL